MMIYVSAEVLMAEGLYAGNLLISYAMLRQRKQMKESFSDMVRDLCVQRKTEK